MPERLNTFTVPSPELQGVDSAVTFKHATYGELQMIRKASELTPEEDEQKGRAYLAAHLVTWNWVDDAGKPLPLPREDIGVLDQLTALERDFLFSHLFGQAQAKNSVTGS